MAEQEPVEEHRPWRGWHVIGRFLPMMFLGTVFIVYGLSPIAPHEGALRLGLIFVWIGAVLWLGAMIGVLFTKCPICNQTNWIFCSQEPDVVRLPYHNGRLYGRDLARLEEKD